MRKYEEITGLYLQACNFVASTPQQWRDFLKSACHNYKLRFDEQLLVYRQRPDATAVLEISRWNNFGRRVNRGARGIAVFDNAATSRQRLRYYFDISDTHEVIKTREVPLWQMRPEYENEVITTLEKAFNAKFNEGATLDDAIFFAVKTATEDNIQNYTNDLMLCKDESALNALSDEALTKAFRNLVEKSAAVTIFSRLGQDTTGRFKDSDFSDISKFDTAETLYAVGSAVNAVSKACLLEIARKILHIQKQNRTFDFSKITEYNVDEQLTGGSKSNEQNKRTDQNHIHDAGRLPDSRPDAAGADGSRTGHIRTDAPEVSARRAPGTLRESADQLQTERTLDGSAEESNGAPGDLDQTDGGDRGHHGAVESGRHDELGSQNEQFTEPDSRNRIVGSDLRLEYYDRAHEDKSLPFFGDNDTIREILGTTPHLKATKAEIKAFYETHIDDDARTEFVKSIFNNDFTEIVLSDGRRVGYKTFQNVLQLWEGSYLSRTKQAFYDWGVIAQHFEAMRLLGELYDTAKPLPSIEEQVNLLKEKAEEEKTSAFSFSQEIIDAVLTRGSGVYEGKFRIFEQFEKSLSSKENVDFLKNEYGWGGAYPVITGTGIDEQHDKKGIHLSKGFGPDKPHITLLWNQVEKRIAELIRLDRYLNPKEKDLYPEWLAKQKERRAELEVEKKNREILSSAPPEPEPQQVVESKPEPEPQYAYHLGDKVYMGADEYEILAIDEKQVRLFDTQFPLFNKEIDRTDFDSKIRENPMNDHLKVKELPPEQKTDEAPVFDIGMGYLGNGLTVWNRAVTENGDYQNIAHISGEGEIHYYIDNLPKDVVERIEKAAAQEQQKTLFAASYHVGNRVYLNGKPFEITRIDDWNVELMDRSVQNPQPRLEPKDRFMQLVQQNERGSHFTDAYREYSEIKHEYSGSLVLYQVGDFFEAYGEDAQSVSEALELTLTSRSLGNNQKTEMCGFPAHRLETYMNMLLDRGFDVAISSLENGERSTRNIVSSKKEEPDAKDKIGAPVLEKKSNKRIQTFDMHPEIPMSERHTFDLASHEIEEVGKKERFRRNLDAINVLKECEFENRFATPEEQVILSKYVGWGGIPEVFDENNTSWSDEFVELYTVLSPEEYAAARESTLTAFYTPPVVISAIYKAMEQMGFREGNILEPSCGIGHFIGMLPASMQSSKVYGVELDPISAGIAQQLYQKSSIAAQGFEKTNLPDSFFDAVVGNVPFGDFRLADKRYDKHHFLIHDYFFAKSLDKLRPGGVMALVTSKGTMDKENPSVRKYIAQRAELLGAIRLPNNTFKGNAGTEVVSDILFLKKRDRLIDIEPDWVHLGKDANGIAINSYFVEHPDMILGEMKMVSGRFGPEPTCAPYEGAGLTTQLTEAISKIHGEFAVNEFAEEQIEKDNSIPADPTVRNFSYTLLDGKIYFRENSRMAPVQVPTTTEKRIKGMIAIRDCVRTLISLQTEESPEAAIEAEQKRLNDLYDAFTEKYGLLNSRANASAFSQDSSRPLLLALEILREDGTLDRKADMFFKRTIKPHKPVTSVDTSSEALAVSMSEKACVDMEYMCELSGKTEEEIFADLKGVIFLNPMYGDGDNTEAKYLMSDEYLSGNVREKLALARSFAESDPENYAANVEALEKVQPKDLPASEIAVRLGTTWIPLEIFQQFIFEFLGTPRYAQWNIKLQFSQFTNTWSIAGKSYDQGNVKAYSTYGTKRINAYKIIEETLNLKDVRIFDYVEDADGKKKAVLNKKETAIALSKQELIKQGFQDWVWTDPARRERLCKIYNETYNSSRPREYDGRHLTFPGMNPEIELREHQKNAVAHMLYGGNTLLAHTVGAGKTFEIVAAVMEAKRLGLFAKAMIVVPNHLTEQWATEFLLLYPAANILVATKKDFETKNRKKFCGRIATGDYDAIIIGHSQFEKIPMSIERQRQTLNQQLDEIITSIAEEKRRNGNSFSVKQLERTRKSVQLKLDKLNDQSQKDDVVTFEELGVDRIFIDESHYFKNLFLYTKMRNVGGIAQTEAQKSSDLFMKCRYLDELTGSRGVVFATGTPISNSMVELYTIQRYLQYDTLVKHHLQHFDAWASTFGETISAVELTPEGSGYRAKTRFARFYNLPELMAMFKEVADIKTADMLNLPVPKAIFHNISVKPSEIQKQMVAELAERAEKVRNGLVDATEDNMLKITNDGRKLALDQRLINPLLPDFEGSKLNACVDTMFETWEKGKEKRLTQLFFCDLSTPKGDGSFSVYDDIRQKLIERGVPPEEIKFIHEADTEAKKQELFKKVCNGDVRILMGSTQKMGAGTNVQNKLAASIDLDCPWRPSDLEQRLGRSIRQGNENKEVDIYRFVTEGTFDAYLYQLVESKQKFISQIMTSKSPVRSCEDIDETALSYAEIKMLATGNPYIKEKMDLDLQVQKLRLLKSSFLSEKYALEDKILKFFPQTIAQLNETVAALEKDLITAQEHPKPTDDQFVGMEVKGVFYSDKAKAGQAIIETCKAMTSPDGIPLGKYRGFDLELFFDTFSRNYMVKIQGASSRAVELGSDIHGNITRIDNAIERIPDVLTKQKNELENTKQQLATAQDEVKKPFSKEEELKTKSARLDELNILLNLNKKEGEIIGGEPVSEESVSAKSHSSRIVR